MGKNKRLKQANPPSKKNKLSKISKLTRPSGISKSQQAQTSKKDPSKSTPQIFHLPPTLPFSPSDTILLIGEGDLSFACSLITHHGCTHVTATVLESEKELREKYPHVGENISLVEEGGGAVRYGVDAGKLGRWKGKGRGKGVDRVVFNFPHVGGKSTDVNRQVRYNQELLVSFFTSSLPLLSPTHGSSIIVTLFEGEPYTLWNIRDLARHSGLEVAQSFKFQAKAYPGYKHARTLGVVKGKGGGEGGWKGEERPARTYVFVRRGEGEAQGPGPGKKGKGESSDDEDEVEDEDEEEEEEEEEEEVEGLEDEDGIEDEDGDSNGP